MRSSEGLYFEKLDHVRALAALLVFLWHYTHARDVVPDTYVPGLLAPLAFGHCGVSLFMVLSGYLFAKLLDGRQIIYSAFLWNRALRLFPLLILVIVLAAYWRVKGWDDLGPYVTKMLAGFVMPGWPNGGWSIAVELHFYIVLPVLLWMARKNATALVGILAAALAFRSALYLGTGSVQYLSYLTIVGRIDQFVVGIAAFMVLRHVRISAPVFAVMTLAFCVAYWLLGETGAFARMNSYQNPHPAWVWIPTLEAVYFASLILFYERSGFQFPTPVARFLALAGALSYSIYLLHPFLYLKFFGWMQKFAYTGQSWYVLALFGVLGFVATMPVAYVSYRLVEMPFMRWRRRYTVAEGVRSSPQPQPAAI